MGGLVTIVVRDEEGIVDKFIAHTACIGYFVKNKATLLGDIEERNQMITDIKHGRGSELAFFAPKDYGIVVLDFLKNNIVSFQDSSSIDSFHGHMEIDVTHEPHTLSKYEFYLDDIIYLLYYDLMEMDELLRLNFVDFVEIKNKEFVFNLPMDNIKTIDQFHESLKTVLPNQKHGTSYDFKFYIKSKMNITHIPMVYTTKQTLLEECNKTKTILNNLDFEFTEEDLKEWGLFIHRRSREMS